MNIKKSFILATPLSPSFLLVRRFWDVTLDGVVALLRFSARKVTLKIPNLAPPALHNDRCIEHWEQIGCQEFYIIYINEDIFQVLSKRNTTVSRPF